MWWDSEVKQLDTAKFEGDAETHRLATVISEEIEAARAVDRSKEVSERGSAQPMTNLLGQPVWPSDSKPWFEYALSLDLLSVAAERLGVSLPKLTQAVHQKLSPPNWQAFFWMSAWLNEISAERNKARHLGLLLSAQADWSAVAKAKASTRAKAAADARHNMPGGSRDKAAAIKQSWATGKYASRDICAEQECAALEMSFAAARKALRNTPDPA